MRRRDFIVGVGAATAFPRIALGQVRKTARVAWLALNTDPSGMQALLRGLADLGYVEGSGVVVQLYAAPTSADLPAVAAQIAGGRPDVIVTSGSAAALAAKAATTTIPVIFTSVADPIGVGLVPNLAHSGSNVSGMSTLTADLVGKGVALLNEIVPAAHRFAAPLFTANPSTAVYRPQMQAAARALAIEPVFIELVDGQDLGKQLDGVLTAGVQAVFQPGYTEINPYFELMYDLYLKNRLPAVSVQPLRQGTAMPFFGVVHYASNTLEMIRTRGASMVDEVLKGTRPADIPVEQPTVFDLAVNLDLAGKIGVTVPLDILAQATLVIDYDIRAPKGAK